MRTILLATAALFTASGALAQTAITTQTPDGQMVTGPTTQVIALGDHYTIQQVQPDGTVLVKTLTAEQAAMARDGRLDLQTAMATPPSSNLTTGAGASSASGDALPNVSGDLPTTLAVAPLQTAMATQAPMTTTRSVTTGNTTTTTTVRVVPKAQPAPVEAVRSGERG